MRDAGLKYLLARIALMNPPMPLWHMKMATEIPAAKTFLKVAIKSELTNGATESPKKMKNGFAANACPTVITGNDHKANFSF